MISDRKTRRKREEGRKGRFLREEFVVDNEKERKRNLNSPRNDLSQLEMPPEIRLQLSVRRIRDSKLGQVVLLHLEQESKDFLVRETVKRSSESGESGTAGR